MTQRKPPKDSKQSKATPERRAGARPTVREAAREVIKRHKKVLKELEKR